MSDGTHTAKLILLGQYIAANFAEASDGATGTLITDPPVTGPGQHSLIATPHHA